MRVGQAPERCESRAQVLWTLTARTALWGRSAGGSWAGHSCPTPPLGRLAEALRGAGRDAQSCMEASRVPSSIRLLPLSPQCQTSSQSEARPAQSCFLSFRKITGMARNNLVRRPALLTVLVPASQRTPVETTTYVPPATVSQCLHSG